MIARIAAFAWIVLAVASARGQDQSYDEDFFPPAEAPAAFRATAEKAAPGAGFDSAYRDQDRGWRFVAAKPGANKTVVVRVGDDGRLVSVRTAATVAITKVPPPARAAVEAEARDNLQIPGFRAQRATSVTLLRPEKGTTEAFFELFGPRGDGNPARAEVTAEGVVRRAEIIVRNPIHREDRIHERKPQAVAASTIPEALRRKVVAAAPGVAFTRAVREFDAFSIRGQDKNGRKVEVRASAPESVAEVLVQVGLAEVPAAVLAKLRSGLEHYDADRKTFRPSEAERLTNPFQPDQVSYRFRGTTAAGKPTLFQVRHDGQIDQWEDDRDRYEIAAAEARPESIPVAGSAPGRPPGKLEVLIARYGAGDRWVDVTGAIRDRVKEGRLAASDAGPDLPDPAPGTPKELAVVYGVDGKVGLSVAPEGRGLTLPPGPGSAPPAEVPLRGFAVLGAWYGIGEKSIDPAAELRSRIKGDRLDLIKPWGSLPDPLPSITKSLLIAYAIDGEVGLWALNDTRDVALPGGRPRSDAATELWAATFPASPTWADFAADGRSIVAAFADGSVRVLDAADGRETALLAGPSGRFNSGLAISPAGAVLVTENGRPARYWPTRATKQPTTFGDPAEQFTVVALAPAGKLAATTAWGNATRLWDTSTGKEVRRFEGNEDVVMGLVFSPDGRRLLTSGWDGSSRLYEVATGKELRQYEGDNGRLTRCALARDGSFALVVSDRGFLVTWDLATGKERSRHHAPINTGWALALRPRQAMADGRRGERRGPPRGRHQPPGRPDGAAHRPGQGPRLLARRQARPQRRRRPFDPGLEAPAPPGRRDLRDRPRRAALAAASPDRRADPDRPAGLCRSRHRVRRLPGPVDLPRLGDPGDARGRRPAPARRRAGEPDDHPGRPDRRAVRPGAGS